MKEHRSQQAICAQYGAAFEPPSENSKVGIALDTLGLQPLNALRHRPEHGTSGWYIWGGEHLSSKPGFFQPLHMHHLVERCPVIVPFLALGPGWRILIAPGQMDVWYDITLLNA